MFRAPGKLQIHGHPAFSPGYILLVRQYQQRRVSTRCKQSTQKSAQLACSGSEVRVIVPIDARVGFAVRGGVVIIVGVGSVNGAMAVQPVWFRLSVEPCSNWSPRTNTATRPGGRAGAPLDAFRLALDVGRMPGIVSGVPEVDVVLGIICVLVVL
jgi:hypothetical protein